MSRLAGRQHGVVTRGQLRDAGLTDMGVARWIRDGHLHRVHRGVYAMGHPELALRGRVMAALLWAGPRALLSHTTAGWWWQLLIAEPSVIHLSLPVWRKPVKGVRVHKPRTLDGTTHRGLRLTTVTRTLLDLASMLRFGDLRRALAEADYKRLLDVDALRAAAGRGHPGAAKLGVALARHQPLLARTLSELEERFVELCENHGIPLPEINVRIAGFLVDAVWKDHLLIVELDGHAAHATPAAIERDRRRDLALRAAGYRVLRYTWSQVTDRPDLVAADLRLALAASER